MSIAKSYLLATAIVLGCIALLNWMCWGAASLTTHSCWPLPDSFRPLAIMGAVLCAAFVSFIFFAFIYACAQGLRERESED